MVLIVSCSRTIAELVASVGSSVLSWVALANKVQQGMVLFTQTVQGFQYLYQIQKGIKKLKNGCDVMGWQYLLKDFSVAKLARLMAKDSEEDDGEQQERIEMAKEELAKNDRVMLGDPNHESCKELGPMPSCSEPGCSNKDAVAVFKAKLFQATKPGKDGKRRETKIMWDALAGTCGLAIKIFAEGARMQEGMQGKNW